MYLPSCVEANLSRTGEPLIHCNFGENDWLCNVNKIFNTAAHHVAELDLSLQKTFQILLFL